jgi:hypothetical protein
MGTWQYDLAEPPAEPRALELWLQHAAGFILFEDVRRRAMDQMDPNLPSDARAAAQKGIDDAVGALMQVIDGVSGGLWNETQRVDIDFIVRLRERGKSGSDEVLSEVDLAHGDGMCMGYHGWLEGDFGTNPVAVPKRNQEQ